MFPIYSNNLVLPDTYIQYKLNSYDHLKRKPEVLSYALISQASNLSNIKNTKPFNKLKSRNLWQKLINQYWQETVYLSMSHPDLDTYTKKMKSYNFVYDNVGYKYFINAFIKSLVNNRIPVTFQKLLNANDIPLKNNYSFYLKYIWRKKIFLCLDYINFFSKSSLILSNKSYKAVAQSFYNSLPLFSIINNDEHIVMAETREALNSDKNFINNFTNYLSFFFSNKLHPNVRHTCLFFISPEDATEYKNYIKASYVKSSRGNDVDLSISSLQNYYKLISVINRIDFRLIPDLKEVGDMVYRYQYYNNIAIDKNQIYGQNYFKGQPIYIIKTIKAKHKHTNILKNIDYSYNINNDQIVFLNYQNAILAWNNFKDKHVDYKLPVNPELYVYNLEDFIKTYSLRQKILLVPGFQAYSSIKNSFISRSNVTLKQTIHKHIIWTKKIMERIIWSLTSRQPLI